MEVSATTEKPVVVVTRPPLPPEVDQRVNRDFRPGIAATPESLTPDGLLAHADGASALALDNVDAVLGGRPAPTLVTKHE